MDTTDLDTRDRRPAEIVLCKQAELLRVTLASIGDAVITTDPAGRITSLNPVAAALTGWTPEKAVGRPLDEVFYIINEQTRQPVPSPAKRSLREGTVVGLPDYTVLVARDGTERLLEESAAPIKDAAGQVLGVVLIFRDVTADRRKDEFLAILAHELRNPLAPIRNAVQILRAKGPPLPELQWARDVIDRQVHQLTRLVDDLLDVSRISRGRIELRKERVALATVVSAAVEGSRPLLEKWGHELTVMLPPEPFYLDVDVARLGQVLLNLLNNAAKYTDQGGRIWLSARREHEHVIIRLKDTGIGIPRQMLPRIFEMFTQVQRSLDRSEGGLGIGLTLVKRLVEMHGGTVTASSDGPGTGSEFTIRLPLAPEPPSQGALATAGAMMVVPARYRILVVDDEQDAADSLAMLLRMTGHEVHTAHDGLEAVGAAAVFRPEVVLLDIGLPKLNGHEAGRRIRAQQGPHVVLVALTGWGQDEDRRRSSQAGFDCHMTKPVEFNVLQKLLAGLKQVHCAAPE
jgi:PAS domain S-box-containing protein